MKRAGNFFKRIKTLFALSLVIVAVFCTVTRLPQVMGDGDSAALAAAAFTLTDGKYSPRSAYEPKEMFLCLNYTENMQMQRFLPML